MKSFKFILFFLVIITVFCFSSTIFADSFKDTLKSNINSEIQVNLRFSTGLLTGFVPERAAGSTPTLTFTGVLVDVQDDYIKVLVDKKKEVFIKIEDISSYQVNKK